MWAGKALYVEGTPPFPSSTVIGIEAATGAGALGQFVSREEEEDGLTDVLLVTDHREKYR